MKKQILIIFGGRSAEHEVSIRSAKNVAAALDQNKYSLNLVGISKEGSWYHFQGPEVFENLTSLSDKNLPKTGSPCLLSLKKGKTELLLTEKHATLPIDLAFPVLHGTFGEDGCIQGLFKMMNLPFVGCGVLGSSMGMDKEVMKRLLKNAGIPSAKYEVLYSHQEISFEFLKNSLGLPFFIKPANAGSSVGVHKIKSKEEFLERIKDSFKYDHKILAEEFIKGREIEVSVKGLNHEPKASVCGEIVPTHEFYSYEAKYIDDNGAHLHIPAKISSDKMTEVQKWACQAFQVLECDGLSRVDFFLKEDGQVYLNEINTIPGFTKISMYPKMWEASGVSYQSLITELIEMGFQKFAREQALMTNYDLLNNR
jgi:D-alanine-D-alanine ligase